MEFNFAVYHSNNECEPPGPAKHGAVTSTPDGDSISREINLLNRDAAFGYANMQLRTRATTLIYRVRVPDDYRRDRKIAK